VRGSRSLSSGRRRRSSSDPCFYPLLALLTLIIIFRVMLSSLVAYFGSQLISEGELRSYKSIHRAPILIAGNDRAYVARLCSSWTSANV
jgi:hypothetical protein